MTVVSYPAIATGPTGVSGRSDDPRFAQPFARRCAMSMLRIAPGQFLLAAPGRLALSAPLAGAAAGSGSPTVTYSSAIAGLSGWWDAGAITSMLDPTGAAITAFGVSVDVGRPDQQVGGRRHPDRLSRGYQRYHDAGCHAAVERSAGRTWPQYGGSAEPARARPAAPGNGPGPGPDQLSDATGVRQQPDALFSVVAAQSAAEPDRPQSPADHRQHGHAFGRQYRRQQPTAAVPRRAADRADCGPDAPPKQCRISVAASLCSGRVDL